MTDESKQEATEKAKRARGEAKAAVKDAGGAVKAVVEPVAEHAADEVRDTAHKFEGTAQDAAQAARKLPTLVVAKGVLALSISIGSGVFAYTQFRQLKQAQQS